MDVEGRVRAPRRKIIRRTGMLGACMMFKCVSDAGPVDDKKWDTAIAA